MVTNERRVERDCAIGGRSGPLQIVAVALALSACGDSAQFGDTRLEPLERTGAAVAIGDFDSDGIGDLLAGVEAEGRGVDGSYTPDGAVLVKLGLRSKGAQGASHRIDGEGLEALGREIAFGDFNGDGRQDLAMAAPLLDVSNVPSVGGIVVSHAGEGSNRVVNYFVPTFDLPLPLESNIADDASIATGDFNGDGYDDLALGFPRAGVDQSGIVLVADGSPYGMWPYISPWKQLEQGGSGIRGNREAGDRVGETLASGDFNGDGYDDLAIGCPYEDIGNAADSGFVQIKYGSPDGLRTDLTDSIDLRDGNGLPGETRASTMTGYALATGDFDGDGYEDLAIGSPFDRFDGTSAAGRIDIKYGRAGGFQQIGFRDQRLFRSSGSGTDGSLPGVRGSDRVGLALASGDFNGDGFQDLAAGSPGTGQQVGEVLVVLGSDHGLSEDPAQTTVIAPGEENAPIDAQDLLLFGSVLAAGDLSGDGVDDLAVGVPRHSTYDMRLTGAVVTVLGTSDGLVGRSLLHTQGSDNTEGLEEFGFGTMKANDTPAEGVRPLLVVLANTPDNTPHSPSAANDLQANLFGNPARNIPDLFLQNSGGRFTWKSVGVLGPFDLPPDTGFCNPAVAEERRALRRAAVRAAAAATDFLVYDTNGDGIVEEHELGIFISMTCDGTPTGSAEVRELGCISGTFFCGRVASGRTQANFETIAHELSHLLGTKDLYNGNCSGGCFRATLMSATIGTSAVVHIDPGHRLTLGWLNPRVYNLNFIGDQEIVLQTRSRPGEIDYAYSTALFYDDTRGTEEYFLVELRQSSTPYDTNLADQGGVAVWNVRLNENKKFSDTDLISPKALGLDTTSFWDTSFAPFPLLWSDGPAPFQLSVQSLATTLEIENDVAYLQTEARVRIEYSP